MRDYKPEHDRHKQNKESAGILTSQAGRDTAHRGIQTARISPGGLTPGNILILQAAIGNQAVGRLLQAYGLKKEAGETDEEAVQMKEEASRIEGVLDVDPGQAEILNGAPALTIQRETIDGSINTTNPGAKEIKHLDEIDGKTFDYEIIMPDIGITHSALIDQLNLRTALLGPKFVLTNPNAYIIRYGLHEIKIKGPQGKEWVVNIKLKKLKKKKQEAFKTTYTKGEISGSLGTMTDDMHKIAHDYGVDDVTLNEALSALTSENGKWNAIRTVKGDKKIISELKLSRLKGEDKRFFAKTRKGGKVLFDEFGDHL